MNKKQALLDEIAALADRVAGDEYDEGVRSAVLHSLALVNKHLPDNEVSVPVDETLEAFFGHLRMKHLTEGKFGIHASPTEVDYVMWLDAEITQYKAMLQAHKSEEV